jgi:hypothetical protein
LPSIPESDVKIKVPPMSDVESPIADTVTSIVDPQPTKGGSEAVTITAARLRVRIMVLRTLTPSRSSMDDRDCSVKGVLRSVSPVPCRPTTTP